MFSRHVVEVAEEELENNDLWIVSGGNENNGGWGPAERSQNGLLVVQL
jgi:hypothetical protein